MQAIEFTAESKNGIIEVPKQYQAQLQDHFRVIILQEPPTTDKKLPRKKRTLSPIQMKTKGLKFDREEANAR